jgi:hypothetical protein
MFYSNRDIGFPLDTLICGVVSGLMYIDKDGAARQEQEHLYVKILLTGDYGNIDNYIGVSALEGV